MIAHRRSMSSIVFALALVLSSVAFNASIRASDEALATGDDFALYSASLEGPYVPLDPETLADVASHEPRELAKITPDMLFSADGSTVVQVEHGAQTTIVVSDGAEGPERLRFQPGRCLSGQYLSDDGNRLVTVDLMTCGPSGCAPARWSVFDTRDGHLITEVEGDKNGYGPLAWVDAGAERLYQLAYDRGQEPDGPWPIEVVAFDLTTGKEAGRLAVPGVHGGSWWTRSVDGMLVGDQMMPAVAVSPDGNRLAVVDAETERLTLIDTATMSVEGTTAVAHRQSTGHRILTWLGIVPQTAEAKVTAGRSLEATFAPGGDRLYLWGTDTRVGDAVEDIETRGLGLRLIAVETGEIITEGLEGLALNSVVPAPDDRTVYVTGSDSPRFCLAAPMDHLWRLDSGALRSLAEREFRYAARIAVVAREGADA